MEFIDLYRYMLQAGRILMRQELDAFLAMSVSPLLQDVQTMQDLKVMRVGNNLLVLIPELKLNV